MGRWEDDLLLAHRLADAADEITRARFGAADLAVHGKADATPVSDADTAAEDAIRRILHRERPADAVLGEESGASGDGERRWVIDPIDGTENYVRGIPVWATLIGLLHQGQVVTGLVSAPALGRRWWAASGSGAWTGTSLDARRACQVSRVSRLADASLSYSMLSTWSQAGRLGQFLELDRQVRRSRGFGDFWSHMLVAQGAVDISAECTVSLWDIAALQVIMTEAGGAFTDLDGRAAPDGGSAICANPVLHEQGMAVLSASPPAASHP